MPPGLRVPVRNLTALQRRNADNARCVCRLLWDIADPEAIDSAIRLPGDIRWFDGDFDHEPPYDLIVYTFERCFSSTQQLHPGMRDRAYFSARAILKIHAGAKLQSRELAFRYPIPTGYSSPFQHTDPDFHHIIRMLECNSGPSGPTLDFPRRGENTPTHLLWMSNLFLDLTRVGQNPTLKSYESYLSAAAADLQIIVNTLVMWYTFLGGRVEDEIFWVIDKSYVTVLLPFFPACLLISRTLAIRWN